jgi:DHA1 family multidrug resistance protein-like MFS transporter
VAIVWLGFDFAMPFLPLYVRELGVTSTSEAALWAGILISLGPGLGAVVSPFWGMMADRYGTKSMMIRSLVAFSVLLAASGLVVSMWQFVLVRVGLGVLGGFAPLAFATMLASGPRARAPQALGVLQAAQFLPMAIGPMIGGIIADRVGLRINFMIGAAFCLAALVLLALLLRGAPTRATSGPREGRPKPPPVREMILTPSFALPFAVLFIAYFVDRSFMPVLPLYVAQLGAPTELVASTAGLALALGATSTAISGPILGRLAVRFPLRWLLLGTLGSGIVLLVLIAMAQNVTQFIILRVTLALLAGGLPTLGFTMGAQAAARGALGRQTGLLTSAMQIANAGSPLLSGFIAATRLQAVFFVDAALLCAALVGIVWYLSASPVKKPSRAT